MVLSPRINLIQPVNFKHPLNKGLLAWWLVMPGNKGGSIWKDITKHSSKHDMTLINIPTDKSWKGTSRPGGRGSLDFDGSTSYCNRASGEILLRPDIPVNQLQVPFTFTAWFRTNAIGVMQGIVFQGRSSANDRYHILNITATGAVSCRSQFNQAVTSVVAAADEWHFAAGVWVATDSRFAYIDGRHGIENTGSNTNLPPLEVTQIGRFGDASPSNYFDGQIDDVRIWNRALTDREIKEVYLTSKGG